MPGVTFSSVWTYRGLTALVLENRELRIVVLPELGGKIWSIFSKRHDREMLWHNPRVPPRLAHHGASYDNWFCGGWDEVFPNDFPVEIDGEAWPDHGEIWSLPAAWSLVEQTPDTVSIALQHRGVVLPTRFRKVMTLRAGESSLDLAYEIANDGGAPLDVHWKSHPALPLGPGARLHLPARRVIDEPGFGEIYAERAFAWPQAPRRDGSARDLRVVPETDSGEVEFWYGVDLEDGRAAVSYPEEGIGFGLAFDPGILSSVWVFGTAGGWRGLNTVIVEPCTGYLANLPDAIANGSVLNLAPATGVSTSLSAVVLDGADAIAAFTSGMGSHERA